MKISRHTLKKMKVDISRNPQNYRGNVKLLTGNIDDKEVNSEKIIRRLRKKMSSY